MNRVDKDVMKHLLFYNTDTMTYRTFCDSKTVKHRHDNTYNLL